jgi:hypothetical protein
MKHEALELPVAFFANKEDNAVKNVELLTWATFKERLSTHEIRDTGNSDRDKNGAAFMVALFKTPEECEELIDGYPRRYGDNVDFYYALHFDFDANVTIEAIRRKLLSYEHFGYTSYNHWKSFGVEKFRVIVPLNRPVTPEELRARKDAILEWLGDVDKSTFSIGRLFYMPATSKRGKLYKRTWSNDGDLFNIETFDEKKVDHAPLGVVTASIPDDEMNRSILKELAKLDLSEYEDWFSVGGAMFASGFALTDFQSLSWGDAQESCKKKWKHWEKRAPPLNRGFLINFIRKSNPKFLVAGQNKTTAPKTTTTTTKPVTTTTLVLVKKGQKND